MKCLTICQPYPHLILAPDEQLPHGVERKRVENRTWPTAYRGPLLIHAGKSKAWLRPEDASMLPHLVFGAIVGVADLIDCVATISVDVHRHPWLRAHQHAEGPFCWIVDNVRRFQSPLPYVGRQRIFNVPDEEVHALLESAEVVA